MPTYDTNVIRPGTPKPSPQEDERGDELDLDEVVLDEGQRKELAQLLSDSISQKLRKQSDSALVRNARRYADPEMVSAILSRRFFSFGKEG